MGFAERVTLKIQRRSAGQCRQKLVPRLRILRHFLACVRTRVGIASHLSPFLLPLPRPLLKDWCRPRMAPQQRERRRQKFERRNRNTVAGTTVGLNHIKARPNISRVRKPGLRTRSRSTRKIPHTYKVTRSLYPRGRLMEDDLYKSAAAKGLTHMRSRLSRKWLKC